MKSIMAIVLLAGMFISCSNLKSTTYIKPNDSFILGNNEHGNARVKLKNISDHDIEVYHAPINGGKHSSQIVKSGEHQVVKLDKNTALVINNAENKEASVELKVTGDLGLSMGYKNKQ